MTPRPDPIDLMFNKYAVCPYCGYKHKDSWEWDESGETECGECGKAFTYTAYMERTFTTSPKEQEPRA